MTTWLSEQDYARLRAELAELTDAGATEQTGGPDHRGARIRTLRALLDDAVVGTRPPDDGIAEPGMVLTVRFDDDPEPETFLLGASAGEDSALAAYSPESPLGAAVLGARQGERRAYQVPSGATVGVTLVRAVPYGVDSPH
ncbi:GreA/GreB family elongation factor [Sciscionella sediminilitoris]|uniref:GreA/GreB family elongation factor n=1 Tax=Sciscionella sediminilitoris TaxID=1445613 RepID=UPI0004DF0631|nr:GreA/GreB family elongation factor [Sciscionella sp. SE31]